MNEDCLTLAKQIADETEIDLLEQAMTTGDNYLWDETMQKVYNRAKLLRRGAIIDAGRKADLVGYLNEQIAKGVDPRRALLDLISGSGTRQEAGRVSLDKYIEGVRGTYISKLVDLIDKTRPTLFGLRRASNPEYIENIVKGIFGDAGAKIPKGGQALIDAWHQTTKQLLERFNGAGGNITRLEGFNIPVNHMSSRIGKADKATWIADAKRMFTVRHRPDLPEISDDELLSKIYDNIVSEGTEEIRFKLGGRQYGSKLGNSHQQFRFLQPKSGKDWLEYNSKYGRHSNPIDAMKEYIDSMATEIGLLETLGTNPKKTLEDLADDVKQQTGNARAGDWAVAALDQIRSHRPHVEDWVSNSFRNLRALQVALKLPMTGITVLSDAAFSSVRALFNGFSPLKVFSRQIKNLATGKDYKTAARLGLMAEYAVQRATAAARYADSVGYASLDRVADFATRANGMNHWTNSAKAVFGMEFLSALGEQSGRSFSELNPRLRRALQRYGFDAEDWGRMHSSITTIDGVKFVDPMSDVFDSSMKAKIVGMIREETSIAVPEPNAKFRVLAAGGAPSNTVTNEIIRTATQFKSFGISTMMTQFGIMTDKGLGNGTRATYMASLLATTTAMGVLILQLKEVAKGKSPQELSPELALRGLAQGGAGGVAIDMLLNDPSMFGGVPGAIAGPTAGDINRIAKVLYGTTTDALEGKKALEDKFIPAAYKAAKEIAFPTRLWYTRMAMERLMYDQSDRMLDPDYYSKLRRERKAMRETGQTYLVK
ncbi:MAG: hypothetical protein ACPKM1_15685 [Spirochaetaceae bacterium]